MHQITSHRSLPSNISPKIRGADNFLFILADASIDGYLDDSWSIMMESNFKFNLGNFILMFSPMFLKFFFLLSIKHNVEINYDVR